MRRSHAFTLVELLVVITVLGVLVGLLLPAIGTVRAAAQSSRCQSELRQVGLAMAGYAADQRNLLPPCKNWSYTTWTDTILPYLEATKVTDSKANSKQGLSLWGCPAWKPSNAASSNTSRPGYGMNTSLYKDRTAGVDTTAPYFTGDYATYCPPSGVPLTATYRFVVYSLNKITYPSVRLLVADSSDWNIWSGGSVVTGYGEYNVSQAKTAWDSPAGTRRHGNAFNLLYVDLHAGKRRLVNNDAQDSDGNGMPDNVQTVNALAVDPSKVKD